jgi:monofunctional biosynthetic peptidoglycan transglycosylase
VRKLLKIIGKTVKWVLILFFTSSVLMVLIYKFVPVYITPLMVIRCVEQKMDDREMTLHHEWVPLEEISEHLPVAVMASEDQRFLTHHGFDFDAIQKAAESNKDGKKIRGGSTISQQTAKNVFLWPGRSWIRKGFETYFTFLIELLWSKQRIMEVYLNSIEMGDGIYGVDAVAEYHFNTDAAGLSRADCALIAATLPNPRKFSSKSPSSYMLKRQSRILKEMRYVGEFHSN